jgi:ABC-type molybdate transport system substrate-binding protein
MRRKWLIYKCNPWLVAVLLLLYCFNNSVWAGSELREVDKEIETITVMSDADLAIPLSQISSLFTQGRPISVANNFGDSTQQKKKIEDGESADIFITSQGDLVQQLKIKGLVDVYSIGRIASAHEKSYTIAVVAGEHMTTARVFLDFLKSYEARDIFKANGFTTPYN